ncbi:hypothetical protein V8F20_003894 [Naviculisporaceae sp. PSN 640]
MLRFEEEDRQKRLNLNGTDHREILRAQEHGDVRRAEPTRHLGDNKTRASTPARLAMPPLEEQMSRIKARAFRVNLEVKLGGPPHKLVRAGELSLSTSDSGVEAREPRQHENLIAVGRLNNVRLGGWAA